MLASDIIMQKDNKILILGARGNLGSMLARVLGNEYRLLLWDRHEIDALNFDAVRAKIREHKPNIIINCVANNKVDLIEGDEAEFRNAMQTNGDLPGVLADLALELDAVLVHFVSDYVFYGDKESGYTEADATGAVNKYAETKIKGETEVFKRQAQGLKYYLIRTSKLFGPKGESENAKESFFDLILRLSQDKKEFNMVHGEEISCFTYTLDLARTVREMIRDRQAWGVYHIVNEGPASWYDGAKFMFEEKGITDVKLIPSRPEDHPRPAQRPKYSVLLNTKLPKLRSWKEAIKEYWSVQ